MNTIATIFLLINATLLLLLPLRWAALPLLLGACYMTLGQGVELGPFHFPVIRILIAVGVARVMVRGERLSGPFNGLDGLMVAWAIWAVGSSVFHEPVSATLVNRLGLIYYGCGIYFLLRVFCRTVDDVVNLCRITAILLIPLSLEMLSELKTGRNLFAALGGVNELSEVRNGIVRAQGPFAHSILAGSVGAASLPLLVVMRRKHWVISIAGVAACITMVQASGSSGPILSAGFAIVALAMWPCRRHMRMVRWLTVIGYVVLDLFMKAPAYFLLARIDITGSSTSWHRAELIDAAIAHFPEWWLGGTDYTRHWMPYGVGWSGNHVDVTNYYIMMGIYGGLPLMLLFMAVLGKGFAFVGQQATQPDGTEQGAMVPLVMWGLGAALFAQAATFLSVSYFDQSVVFLYLTLAAICAGHQGTATLDAGVSVTVDPNSLLVSPARFDGRAASRWS